MKWIITKTNNMYKTYSITGDQMKTIKEVEKAMKLAAKQGVHFWDNYGMLTAFNANEIKCPVPDSNVGPPLNEHCVYVLKATNFHGGNADDKLFVSFK